MGFLLTYELIWWEIILIIMGICYIIFHTGHGLWAKIWNFRESKMFQKKERSKILRKHTIEQKKVDTQTRRVDTSLNGVRKKFSAKEKLTLQNIFKNVQAKLVVREYEEARAQIIEGLMIDRQNQDLNILLAQLYEKEDDYEKAEILFRDLILHHDPKKADLYIYLWNNLVAQNKQTLAYDVFKKGLEKEPKNIQLLETMAELGYELHEYEESLIYARKLAETQPKHIRAHELLGLSHLQVGSDQKAYDTFLALRRLDPYNETVLVWLPKIEDKLGIHPDTKRLSDRS
jgi:tetratricopeptide (TPR) repeat protein